MGIDFKIVSNKLPQLIEQLPDFLDQQVAATALLVETDAKKEAPVGTPESTHKPHYHGGRLRASGHTERKGTGDYAVVFSTNYALFVHEGTRRMPARKFLFHAVQKHQDDFLQRFRGLESLVR